MGGGKRPPTRLCARKLRAYAAPPSAGLENAPRNAPPTLDFSKKLDIPYQGAIMTKQPHVVVNITCGLCL